MTGLRMTRIVTRVLMLGLTGAFAGVAAVAIAYAHHPGLTFEMDRELPRFATGFYPVERNGDETFAWTSGRAELRVPRFERRVDWQCVVRLRAARGAGLPLPSVTVAVDGVNVLTRLLSNEFEDVNVLAPARRNKGLSIVLISAPTFVPPADPRELGVQVDRMDCRPNDQALTLPPTALMVDAGAAGALFGAAIGLTELTALAAGLGVLLLAAGQAIPLSTGPAPYSLYADRMVWLAFWTALPVALLAALSRTRREAYRPAAQFVIVWAAAVLYLQLLVLLHPSKPVVDAVFHAHRLEWVLSGRYFFTQPMPSGVQFPYAIGLYVFAAPWTFLTRDYVSLLRIVVCATEVVAGVLLYWMIVRTWKDRLAGAIAVALFSLAPLPYGVIGNANLTNAFAQAAALTSVAAATVWHLRRRDVGSVAALTAITAWALLSHVSTFGLLVATLGSAACLYRWFGGPGLRDPAHAILLSVTAAAVIAVAVYYGHFIEVYKDLNRVGATPAAVAGAETSGSVVAPVSKQITAPPLATRVWKAITLTLTAVGWPIMVLALVGIWRVWKDKTVGRIELMLAGWAVAWAAFLSVGLAPVNGQFERYAVEFIARVDFATYPAAAILAGRGSAWAWRAGPFTRIVSAVVLFCAFVIGLREWVAWLA